MANKGSAQRSKFDTHPSQDQLYGQPIRRHGLPPRRPWQAKFNRPRRPSCAPLARRAPLAASSLHPPPRSPPTPPPQKSTRKNTKKKAADHHSRAPTRNSRCGRTETRAPTRGAPALAGGHAPTAADSPLPRRPRPAPTPGGGGRGEPPAAGGGGGRPSWRARARSLPAAATAAATEGEGGVMRGRGGCAGGGVGGRPAGAARWKPPRTLRLASREHRRRRGQPRPTKSATADEGEDDK